MTQVKANGSYRLGINRKGIAVIEQYLLARRLMNINVYYHGKARAAEFIMQQFLSRLCSCLHNDKTDQLTKIIDPDLAEFLDLAWKFRNQVIDKDNFIQSAFKNYKVLNDGIIWNSLKNIASRWEATNADESELIELANRLIRRELPRVTRLNPDVVDAIKSKVDSHRESTLKGPNGQWKIHVDESNVGIYKSQQDKLYTLDSVGNPRDLKSLILSSVGDRKERIAYLFLDADEQNQGVQLEEGLIHEHLLEQKAA